jgi:hypothetical protein
LSTTAQIITILIAVGGFLLVLWLVRSGRLKERFAAIWLVVGVGMIVLALLRPLVDRLSTAIGIQSGTTTVFVIAVLVILGVLLQLSMAMSKAEDQIRDLAEAVALLSDTAAGEASPPVEPGDDG